MTKIFVQQADITQIRVDAIVNAANSRLLGGSGVDGAIHRAGGIAIMAECDRIRVDQGGCPTGQAVITTAGALPARAVIHTVGPIWHGGSNNEAKLLRSCYINSLGLAEQHGLASIAFPNISTGVYGFPKAQAASIAVNAVKDYLAAGAGIEKVIFVCFDEENTCLYQDLLGNN